MSFAAAARTVRDPRQPHLRRVAALHSCAQMYCPIGFHATLSFLEQEAGPYRSDEAALVRALDLLQASRAVWLVAIEDYAATRRAEKRHGRRTPRRTDRSPCMPGYWYGAPTPAALHALRFWLDGWLAHVLRTGGQESRDVGRCVAAFLDSGGRLTVDQREQVATCVATLLPDQTVETWSADPGRYHRGTSLLKVLRLIEASTVGA